MTEEKKHYSGFINIIGKPNVGKSTLLNAFMGEKMAIITAKPQTTRHRYKGIVSGDDFQIIFSDTPGLISDPHYKLQSAMNDSAMSIFEDADLVLFMIDPSNEYSGEEKVIRKLKSTQAPKFLIINKVDTSEPEALKALEEEWKALIDFDEVHHISALMDLGVPHLLASIKIRLPEGPAYYSKEDISDKSVRFFISEIIREKILINYKQEIPYSVEIHVESYKESQKHGKPFVHIRAIIFVMRNTQKGIIIGNKGAGIKKLGIQSRRDIEKFIGSRCHLELFVKVKDKWRDDDRMLKSFGYL